MSTLKVTSDSSIRILLVRNFYPSISSFYYNIIQYASNVPSKNGDRSKQTYCLNLREEVVKFYCKRKRKFTTVQKGYPLYLLIICTLKIFISILLNCSFQSTKIYFTQKLFSEGFTEARKRRK